MNAIERAMASRRADAIKRIGCYANLAAEHLCKIIFYGDHPVLEPMNLAGWMNTINNKCVYQIHRANLKDRGGKNLWLDYPEVLRALHYKNSALQVNIKKHLRTLSSSYPALKVDVDSDAITNALIDDVEVFVKACLSGKPISTSRLALVSWS